MKLEATMNCGNQNKIRQPKEEQTKPINSR